MYMVWYTWKYVCNGYFTTSCKLSFLWFKMRFHKTIDVLILKHLHIFKCLKY